jgi:methylated-DNA-protein-cysteine methyltransferase related protein
MSRRPKPTPQRRASPRSTANATDGRSSRAATPKARSAKVPKALRQPTSTEVFRERVYEWIRRIPRGKVATYGQIAVLAGYPRQSRRVGQALGQPYSPHDLPWQRVINTQGRVSDRAPRPDRGIGSREAEQERLLMREGIKLVRGKVDLERYRWKPKARLRPR